MVYDEFEDAEELLETIFVDEEFVVFGYYKLEVQAIGLDQSPVEFRESISDSSLCFGVLEKVRKLIEEQGRINPSRWRSAESFLDPKARTFESFFYFILFLDRQSPNDRLIRLNPRLDLGVNKLPNKIILL